MRDHTPAPTAGAPSWTVAQILDFARTHPRLGIKNDKAIRQQLHVSRTRYTQILATLVDPKQGYLKIALQTDPITTHRIIDHLATRQGPRAHYTK
ncbi:DUF3263 domain-containing protein [Microcella alkaliphila]|uniref:Uncharacterized protein n=1 Tax=Microcella alkaliphila TaxID=279828 RepID=A0A0U4WXR4_9MICO|nr:DUF3263 domain-containing protein [Microcella alkaliphila]BAU32488.1 uncharacterized protein MalAC0309_1637 [Microcella alkaliphila]